MLGSFVRVVPGIVIAIGILFEPFTIFCEWILNLIIVKELVESHYFPK